MIYKYLNPETGNVDDVQPERWGWGVLYKDGTELKQFGDDGTFHRIQEINKNNISLFVMYKLDEPDKRFDLVFDTDTMKLRHFYLNTHAHYFADHGKTVRTYVFGYEKNGELHLTFILPDDRVVVADKENVDLTAFALPEN